MNSFEFNKIFAALLCAVLSIKVVEIVAESAYHTEAPEEVAYPVTEPQPETSTAEAAPEPSVSIAELLQDASVEAGENQMRACTACHSFEKGGANKVGPNLWNIVGRDVASVDGFKYSSSLQDVEGEWTYELLNQWLKNPKSVASGTSMAYAGQRKDGRRADMIAYLRSLSDNPEPLPEPDTAE